MRLQARPEIVPAANRATGEVRFVAAFSSYDAQLRDPDSPGRLFEQHYAPRWSRAPDDRDTRRLDARDPSDDTFVTWCLYHAGLDRRSGAIKVGTMAIVGFWDGRVQKLPAERLSDWPDADGRFPWEVVPKP